MTYSELDHLRGKEQVVTDVYERLIAELRGFGPLKIEPKKTCIHLGNRFGFAGVYTRREYVNLEFHLSRRLSGIRIAKVEQASANRFHHTVKLTKPADVDTELMVWLREAYELKA